MSATDIAALATGIAGVIGSITALVVAIGHVLHHDAPAGDAQPTQPDGHVPTSRS